MVIGSLRVNTVTVHLEIFRIKTLLQDSWKESIMFEDIWYKTLFQIALNEYVTVLRIKALLLIKIYFLSVAFFG